MRTHLSTAALILVLALAVTGAAVASTPSPGGNPWDGETMPSATEVTKTATMVVKSVEQDRTLRLIDSRSEEEMVIQLAADVPLKAKRKKDFDGRKELAFDDLEAGQRIRLTYRAEDGRIVGITVLPPRA